jgi:hypothetical protein
MYTSSSKFTWIVHGVIYNKWKFEAVSESRASIIAVLLYSEQKFTWLGTCSEIETPLPAETKEL